MTAGAVRSREEIARAIRDLTPAQARRLKKVAARYAPSLLMSPADLLQEAFLRALDENGRKCPTHVDVVRFLAEAMRSIADGEGDKIEVTAEQVPIGTHDGGELGVHHILEGTPSAVERLVRQEEYDQMLRDLLALFEDDAEARDIIEGEIAGMTADELRALTGLDKTAYDSKRKLIRRRIDKQYPDGWKP